MKIVNDLSCFFCDERGEAGRELYLIVALWQLALGNCRYRYSILGGAGSRQQGVEGVEGVGESSVYIAAKLNKRFRRMRAMKMTIKIALNLWHTKTGTK